jgi:hypothetical protein
MRLLNVKSKRLETFNARQVPSYAILSHTWGDKELTFEDLNSSRLFRQSLPLKVSDSCAKAQAEGLRYVWIDTCCINKTDVNELTEAINSMYQWYRNAEICYVYLSDVDWTEDKSVRNHNFRNSRWFTRGWTLQELLAPTLLRFYDKNWIPIGLRSELYKMIEVRTRIPEVFLRGSMRVSEASVAQRFSWAAFRETTRVEDIAYCLLGIFGINMPLIYGEGDQAFLRLQTEIIRKGGDQSILAWGCRLVRPTRAALKRMRSPNRSLLLATHPVEFAHCDPISAWPWQPDLFEIYRQRIRLDIVVRPSGDGQDALGYLSCGTEGKAIILPLRRTKKNCYERRDGVRPWLDKAPVPLKLEQRTAIHLVPRKLPPPDEHITFERPLWPLSDHLELYAVDPPARIQRSWEGSRRKPSRILSPREKDMICSSQALTLLLYRYSPPYGRQISFILSVVHEKRDDGLHVRLEWPSRHMLDIPTPWRQHEHEMTWTKPPISAVLCRETINGCPTTILRWLGPESHGPRGLIISLRRDHTGDPDISQGRYWRTRDVKLYISAAIWALVCRVAIQHIDGPSPPLEFELLVLWFLYPSPKTIDLSVDKSRPKSRLGIFLYIVCSFLLHFSTSCPFWLLYWWLGCAVLKKSA